jgi:hypothetical protein
MAAKAVTPADHRSLEEYFLTLAKRDTAEADQHPATANIYRGTRIAQAAVHHDRLARLARDSAKQGTAAAEMHRLAGGGSVSLTTGPANRRPVGLHARPMRWFP